MEVEAEIKDITEGNRVFQTLEVGRSMAVEKREENGTIRAGKALLRSVTWILKVIYKLEVQCCIRNKYRVQLRDDIAGPFAKPSLGWQGWS